MKKYDIVVFGATGLVGQYLVEELVKLSNKYDFTYAAAARSSEKLEELQHKIAQFTEEKQLPTILADIEDRSTLSSMCSETNVLLNCVGPYSKYGDVVIRECLESKTHHIDMSGEQSYMTRNIELYDVIAKQKNVYIISACGYDSVPADLGCEYMRRKCPVPLKSINGYANFDSTHVQMNTGTLESMLAELSAKGGAADGVQNRKLLPEYVPSLGRYALSAVDLDSFVVQQSQKALSEKNNTTPISYKGALSLPNAFAAYGVLGIFGSIFALSKTQRTQKILLQYPKLFTMGMFSRGGSPRERLMRNKSVLTLMGTPADDVEDKTVRRMDINGPDPGYISTSRYFAIAGLMVLKESDKMPQKGGVIFPGHAFIDTSMVDKLRELDITFDPKW